MANHFVRLQSHLGFAGVQECLRLTEHWSTSYLIPPPFAI